jgi:DNA polymerase-3 subunit gamma/tau
MRDAMSLLDQVIAWNDQKLDAESVARVLGVASRQVLHDVARALVDGDPTRCLEIVASLSNQGYDVATVARDLLALLRDLVVVKVCKEPGDLLDLADLERSDVQALSERSSVDDLVRLHQGFSGGFDDVVRSGQPRAALEMLLVRLSRRPPLIPIDDLIGRLASLEQRLGAPRQSSPAAPGSSGGGDVSRGAPRPHEQPPPTRPRPREPQAQPSKKEDTAPAKPAEPPRNGAPRAAEPAPSPVAPSANVIAPPASAISAPAETAVTVWRRIVDRVRLTRPDLAALLNHAVVLEARPGHVALAFEAGSIFERSAKADAALIRAAATGEFGSEPELVFSSVSSTASAPTVSAIENKEREERLRAARLRAQEHPRVAEAAQILGAKLKDIQIPDE